MQSKSPLEGTRTCNVYNNICTYVQRSRYDIFSTVAGEKGAQGLRGPPGLRGNQGEQGGPGLGLHLKIFKIGNSYKKGDYVFVKGTTQDVMYVAERDFVAKKAPADESANWVSFKAPAGPKGARGDNGAAGKDGESGARGDKGAPGTPGSNGKAGENGKNGENGIDFIA